MTMTIGWQHPPSHDAFLRRLWLDMTPGRRIAAEMHALGWTTAEVVDRVHFLLGLTLGTGPVADEPLLSCGDLAAFTLAGAARRDPRVPGGWRLRGRPSDLSTVVGEANAVRRNFGLSEIPYPWRAP